MHQSFWKAEHMMVHNRFVHFQKQIVNCLDN